MGALHVPLRGRVLEGGRGLQAVCRQRSADGRSAARRPETGPMATIMAGWEPQKTLRKTFLNHTCVLHRLESKLSCVKLLTRAVFGLFVLCFRGRDPAEAAAHRQEGGGCFQISSYRVGKTNMLVCIRLHTGRLLRWSLPAVCCLTDWLTDCHRLGLCTGCSVWSWWWWCHLRQMESESQPSLKRTKLLRH